MNDDKFNNLLIVRMLCCTFLSRSAQRSAILADPILTFYKVGRVLSVAKRPLAPQHKNTQHTTHNNQHEPPPLPVASAYTSMGRSAVPPNHGAAASYRLAQGARCRVRRRCCWFPCFGRQREPHKKIERKVGLGLRWSSLSGKT